MSQRHTSKKITFIFHVCPSVQPIKTKKTNCPGQHAGLIVQMLFLNLRTLRKIFQQCKTRCFMNMWSNWWVFNRLYSCLAFTPRSKWVHRSALPPLFRRLIASWKVRQNPSTLCKIPINFYKSVGWVFKTSQKHEELLFLLNRGAWWAKMCSCVHVCVCVRASPLLLLRSGSLSLFWLMTEVSYFSISCL